MNTSVFVIVSLVLLWTTNTFSQPFSGSCDSCGRECQSACGTRGFRTCCLNYLKKRSAIIPSIGSEMKLELIMVNKHPHSESHISDYNWVVPQQVFPELVQYYPSLKSFISDQGKIKTYYEKPDTLYNRYNNEIMEDESSKCRIFRMCLTGNK